MPRSVKTRTSQLVARRRTRDSRRLARFDGVVAGTSGARRRSTGAGVGARPPGRRSPPGSARSRQRSSSTRLNAAGVAFFKLPHQPRPRRSSWPVAAPPPRRRGVPADASGQSASRTSGRWSAGAASADPTAASSRARRHSTGANNDPPLLGGMELTGRRELWTVLRPARCRSAVAAEG